MPSIATIISKYVLRNAFVREVMPMSGEVLLGRIILDFLLFACLPVLDVLLVPSTDPRFPIVILSAISTSRYKSYPHSGQQIAFSIKVRIRSMVSRKVKVE